jgi:DNA polymerase-3 subunit beta
LKHRPLFAAHFSMKGVLSMKLTASTKHLGAAIKAVLPAVPSHPGLPLLTGVRINASEAEPALEATDLELSIRHLLGEAVSVQQPGSAVVPGKALAKALKAIKSTEVQFEAVDEDGRVRLHVHAGNRAVTLDGFPSEDWPAIPEPANFAPTATVEAPVLARALELSALCASKDEMRPILTGVGLFFQEGSALLEVVATDSYRLGVIRVPATDLQAIPDRPPLVVPARVVRALARLLKMEQGTVRIGIREPADHGSPVVDFSFADSAWSVRTIEGDYPAWRQVLPEAGGGLLEFDARELESALRAVVSIRGTRGTPVRLTLDDSCFVSLAESDFGSVLEELAGANFSPNGAGPLQVAFNPEYLLDAIRLIGGDRGRMWARDGLKPVLFEGPDRRCALMPVRMP